MCFPLDGWHKAPGKSASDDGMNNNESEITYTRYLDFMTYSKSSCWTLIYSIKNISSLLTESIGSAQK